MTNRIFAFLAGLGAASMLAFLRHTKRAVAPSKTQHASGYSGEPLDINNASIDELLQFGGVDSELAGRIIENRPYRNKLDLLNRMIVPAAIYSEIKHSILVTRAASLQPVKTAMA